MAHFEKRLIEKLEFKDSIIGKHKRPGFKRFIIKFFKRWESSGDPRLPKGVYEEMEINREKDEYHQVVKDAKTGETLHEEHEPLSKHKPKRKN